jgi:hypothetical protein
MGFCTSSLIRTPKGVSLATRAMIGSLAHGFTSGALRSLLLGTVPLRLPALTLTAS